jgi:hypothetical protein
MERRGQRGPNDAVGASYSSILGPLLVEMWHSQLGIATVTGNVDTWTGQIGGRVLPAIDAAHRPPYAADGSFFGGKSVPQTAKAAALALRSAIAFPTPLALNGTRPWLYYRGRFRTAVSAGADTILGVASAAADTMTTQILAASQLRVFWDGATNLNGPTADTSVHDFQAYKDGVNKNFVVDSTAFTAADAGTIGADMVRLAVGTSGSVNSNQADASMALILFCSAYPGATAVAQIRALAAAEFPP